MFHFAAILSLQAVPLSAFTDRSHATLSSLSLSLFLPFSVRALLRATSANLSIVRVSREKCSESGYKKENSAFVHLSLPAFVDTKKFLWDFGTLEAGRRRIKRKCPFLILFYVSWGDNITNDGRDIEVCRITKRWFLAWTSNHIKRVLSFLFVLLFISIIKDFRDNAVSLGISLPSDFLSNNQKIIRNHLSSEKKRNKKPSRFRLDALLSCWLSFPRMLMNSYLRLTP